MKDTTRSRILVARVAVLAAALGGVWVLQGLPASGWPANALLAALLGSVALVSTIPAPTLRRRTTSLVVLVTDLLLVATLGCLLVPFQDHLDLRLAFLAAFIVANLVAATGHSVASGILGGLAGTMVLALSAAWLTQGASIPALSIGLAQTLMLLTTAQETALFAYGESQRQENHKTARLVAQQFAARENEAEERSALMVRLVEATSEQDIVEIVLDHLRTRYPMRAHGMVLGGTSPVAIWQEEAALDEEEIEARRARLEASLRHTGSSLSIATLRFRSLGARRIKVPRRPRTYVEVPVRAHGRPVGVLVLADPNPNALESHRIGALTDTARQVGETWERMVRRLELETRRTALILREMRDGVLLLDASGDVLIANPAAQRAIEALGAGEAADPAVRLGPVTLEELGRLPPGITRRFRCDIAAVEGKPGMHFACSAVPVMDGGKRVGTLVAMSDVSDEHHARQRLIRSERLTLVGQTLAGVAHELNNPLAALMGYADLLRASTDLPRDVADSIHRIRKQAVRATRIVKNLLNFARRGDPERMPTHLGPLVEETIELFAYEARINRVELHVELSPDLPRIYADRHAIQQIIVNLLQNALHALRDPELTQRSVWITTMPDAGDCLLTVRDSGTGIDDKVRARIFEPFFTTKDSSSGTGLGLALSRSIARDHGGMLDLEPSSPGVGACFSLRLPVHREVAERSAPVVAPRARVPHHILVVDDEASIRDAVKAQLARYGAMVDEADGAPAAQSCIRSHKYDAILLDLRMPGSSGLDLHQAILAQDAHLASRVVFMTGDFVNDELLEAVQKTGVPLLEKPFTEEELTATLSSVGVAKPVAQSQQIHVPVFPTTTTS